MSAHAVPEEDDLEPSSWEPVDFTDVLKGIVNGTLPDIEPQLLSVDGAGFLLYRERVNGIHGNSNAGKTWSALMACAQELRSRRTVFYVDYEDSVRGLLERLVKVFGVPPVAIRKRFVYISPKGAFDPDVMRALIEQRKPSLVVFDSTGVSMAMDGVSPMDDEDVAYWFNTVPGFVADLGPSVLLLDHIPKATDTESKLWPTGSQRKRAAITGAQYLQELVRPFSKEQSGFARIVCAKDRNGTYAEGQAVAELKVDVVGARGRVSVVAPMPREALDEITYKQRLVKICNVLHGAGEPMSKSKLRGAVGGDSTAAGNAIDWLVDSGYIKREQRGQSQLHTLIRMYEPGGEATE